MKAPAPPPTPDPYKLSNAQQLANISVAVASMVLQNANEDTEEYTTGFTKIADYTLADPQYDSTGALVGTTNRDIPVFKKIFALKPTMKALWDQENIYKAQLNQFAIQQTSDMATRFSAAFSIAAAPAGGSAPAAPVLSSSVAAPVLSSISNDYATEREHVRQAMLDRLEYQIGLDLDALEAKLANQGIFPGMAAYEREMRVHTNKVTDARIQIDLAAGQEASRMIKDTREILEFGNSVNMQKFQTEVTILEFGNSVNMRRFQALRDLADFANAMRERYIQEKVIERNQVLNELSAIVHGGQISMPQMTPTKGGQVAGTDLIGTVMGAHQMDMAKWQSSVDRQQAMLGGIAGIAGGILSMPIGGGMSFGGSLLAGMKR